MSTDELLVCCVLALASGLAIYRARGSQALTEDEGYLWYGALRTREGALPVRDFRAYEPGRYWWTAAWMRVLGCGVGSVRVAALLFYVGGMAAALTGLRLAGMDWVALGLTGALLLAWANPIYKLFEPALLLYGFCSALLLLLEPGPLRAAAAGIAVGAAAVFGLNYGLYLAAGMSCIALAVMLKGPVPEPVPLLLSGLGGAALGSAPLWIVMLFSPAFRSTLFERRVRTLIRRGTTNLPLPVPHLWRPIPDAWRNGGVLGWGVGAALFLVMPVLGFAALAGLAMLPWADIAVHSPWLAAGALLAFAQHHAYSRADLLHLCQVMPLLAVGGVALAGSGGGTTLLVVALSLLLAAAVHPLRGLKRKLRGAFGRGTKTLAGPRQLLVGEVRRLHAAHLEPGETVLALPRQVYLYPMLGLRSPVYDTYCVYPASEEDQSRMLEEIGQSGVRLAVIEEHALDGREDLRFSRTHPRIWAHLQQTFTKLPPVESQPDFHFFLRDAAASAAPRAT